MTAMCYSEQSGAIWLFVTGLLGLIGLGRKKLIA